MAGRLGTARIGVLTIVDMELQATREAFAARDYVPDSGYLTSDADDPPFVICQSPDRSNVPAAGGMRQLIEDFRPELLMVVGIAGGVLARGVGLGDVVVPDYLHYGDFRKLSGAGDQRRYYAYDPPSVTIRQQHVDRIRHGEAWRERISAERPEPGTCRVHVADLVAGEKLLGDPSHEEQKAVLDEFTSAIAIDMESVGAARAVHEARRSPGYNPRFLVVRGVSDDVSRAPALRLPGLGPIDLPSAPRALKGLARLAPEAVVTTARRVSDATGLSAALIDDNSEQRKRWRPYAANAAACFAAEVAESYLGLQVGEVSGS